MTAPLIENDPSTLPAWIAENVLGHAQTDKPEATTAEPDPLFWVREDGRVYLGNVYRKYGQTVYSREWKLFSPLDTPAAALMVLEHCSAAGVWPEIKRLNNIEPKGHYVWYHPQTGVECEAPNLCTAISKFAQQYFLK